MQEDICRLHVSAKPFYLRNLSVRGFLVSSGPGSNPTWVLRGDCSGSTGHAVVFQEILVRVATPGREPLAVSQRKRRAGKLLAR